MTIFQDNATGLEPWANSVVDNTRVGMMVFETGSGRILGANAAAARQFGTVDQPLAGVTIDHFLQPSKGNGSLQSWLAERPVESLTELSAQRPDGSRFPVWASFNALPDADPPLMAVLFHDITDQKAHEESLRKREERYELAMRGANDGIWDWDIRASRVFFSPRWKSMLGYEEDDIGSAPQDWFSRVHPDDVRELRRVVGKAHSGGSPNFTHEYRIRRKDGTYAWVLLRGLVVCDESGRPRRMAGSQTDVSAQKHSEDRLQHEALHDALTGLPNRSMFMDRLKHAVRRNRRHTDQLFAVLFLDLDRFKVINDSLGHLIGDQLLIEVSERLRGSVRSYDVASRVNDNHPSSGMVSRLGGDEFAILLDGLRRPEDAARVAERIQQRLQEPFLLANNEIFSSTSIGIAVCKGDYDRADKLLRDADTAMYRAKSLGKARYAIFDDTLHDQALNRLQFENDLHRALEHDEFVMYYQPIIALDTGTLNAFETLIRWHHPDKGFLSPADFMKIAEETGLVARMGWWAFGEALRQQGVWLKQAGESAPRHVSVNLSSKEIMHPSIVAQIEDALAQSNLDAGALNIEITETVIVDNPQSIADTLGRLRDLGVHLSLDDFGTGYSSLSYLHEFPIENVKIDRSFVKDIGPDSKKNEIAAAITRLCHNLGLTVTAEGVETHSQLECLRSMGCDYVQGYLFAPPLPADEASDLLCRGALTPDS